MGSILCEHCTAACCRYVGVPIEKPTTRRDFDDMRWYLMHRGIIIFVEEGDWYIQFSTPCENLQPDNLCAIYEARPEICREYLAGDCDYSGGDYRYELLLTSPEDVEQYAFQQLGKKGLFDKPPSPPQRKARARSLQQLKVLGHHG